MTNLKIIEAIYVPSTHFESMQRLREVLARSPPGTQAEGSLQTPNYRSNGNLVRLMVDNERLTLKPVGHQSTNWIVRLVLMLATAACTSLGTTSPRYNRQQATAKNNLSVICCQECCIIAHYICLLSGHTLPSGYHSRSKRMSFQPQSFVHGQLYRPKEEARRWQEGNGYGESC